MKQSGIVLPGYKIGEYMLIVNQHEELSHKVTSAREQFNKQYEVEAKLGKPNLLLASFTQYAMMEERIVQKLNTIAMAQFPFKIELRNFGSFPSHTIFINVVSKVPIQALVKKIRTETQSLMKLNEENKPYFSLEPHLTIAKKLKPWQYEKGWLEYSNKNFTGRFIADGMLLLKRPVGEMKYQIVKRFEFQNLPVVTKQGELFF